MKESEAYDRLCKEYLSKCREAGCDGCIAQYFCIANNLRHDRYPQSDCPEKLKAYLRQILVHSEDDSGGVEQLRRETA